MFEHELRNFMTATKEFRARKNFIGRKISYTRSFKYKQRWFHLCTENLRVADLQESRSCLNKRGRNSLEHEHRKISLAT